MQPVYWNVDLHSFGNELSADGHVLPTGPIDSVEVKLSSRSFYALCTRPKNGRGYFSLFYIRFVCCSHVVGVCYFAE